MSKNPIVLCLLAASALQAVPENDSELSWRIVGGSDAPEGEYPYQISLRYKGIHNCGGSIVAKNYIVTAAHCVSGFFESHLSVVAGTNKLSRGGTIYDILSVHYHEDYDPEFHKNDVAILKVETITFTDKVAPIAVETHNVGGGEDVVLSGWGRTRFPGPKPDDLQYVSLKTTTVKYCQGRHDFPPVQKQEICTLTETGEGACKGDSGGPLVRTVRGERRLVGIVSWGRPCARGVPDVYARVSSFADWFNDKCNNCLES